MDPYKITNEIFQVGGGRLTYKKSLELLLSLEAGILCEGHYGIINGTQEVTDFIKSFLNKEGQ